MKIERSCEILDIRQLNPAAVQMTLAVGDMVRASQGGPGRFVHIRCGDAMLLRRPISVCSWTEGEQGDTLTLVFEPKGEGTRWLAARRAGERLDVLGLLGRGFDLKPGGRCLLVGGGIGVPPMLGCAQYAGGSCDAVLGFRSADRAILLDEFTGTCGRVDIATDDGSMGFHGFVNALVRQRLEEGKRYQAILACGPRPMLKSVAAVAAEFGVPCQVSMEERMGCGVGACLVCACDMKDGRRKHVCTDGPVFDAGEVDWDA